MKKLKNLVHTIYSELKQSNPKFKKSHVYELVSAYCGYGSYAAYQSDLSFNKITPDEVENAQAQCFDRSLALGFDAADGLTSCKIISNVLQQPLQNTLQIEKLIQELENSPEVISKDVLASLSSLIGDNCAEARLLTLVMCLGEISFYEDNPDNRGGEYWHGKRLSGEKLNSFQLQVAEHFVYVKRFKDLLQNILKDEHAANLPIPMNIKPIVSQFNEACNREYSDLFEDAPVMILDAIGYLSNHHKTLSEDAFKDVYVDWLGSEIIVNPCNYSIAERIYHSRSVNEKWFWHLYGLNNEVDVTKDDLRAINANTGEDYDDYGPMEVVGFQMISLPDISENDKSEMMKLADTLSKENVYA
ncbi:hypothetical protein CW745_05075 [Psychromonas sp. psych-6C06]|uniref:hypothetical protein n=1 Tax=Psychromonas sp. psych-6C06 TaxID=2058089 RepID=UPI000C337AC5|nr:hypothetical protein [Psychromonas sp. psych-6C06]PKF62797.1 hypothetical protein CW745_05075 [Psychromonas sp. psych-6C06]